MNEGRIIAVSENFEIARKEYIRYVETDLRIVNNSILAEGEKLKISLGYDLARQGTQLIQAIEGIYLIQVNAVLIAYRHYSPSLIATLTAIWGVLVFVYKTVKWIVDILHIEELMMLADILSIVWPAFREKMNQIYAKVSEFSETIGWGADGLSHLITAVQSGIGVVGGLTGKDDDWITFKGADKAIDTLQLVSKYADEIQENPSRIMSLIGLGGEEENKNDTNRWWSPTLLWLEGISYDAKEAMEGVQTMFNEISAIQENMPAVVARNIPPMMWTMIDQASGYIYNTILPGLSVITSKMNEIDNMLDRYSEKFTVIGEKLAHPGDILEGLVILPDFAREAQLDKIDYFTSLQLQNDASNERDELSGDIQEFDLIMDALQVPTPEPVFMSIEAPERREALGIVLEPSESWLLTIDY